MSKILDAFCQIMIPLFAMVGVASANAPYKLYTSFSSGKSQILTTTEKTRYLEHNPAPIFRAAIGLESPADNIYTRIEAELGFVNFKTPKFAMPGTCELKNSAYKNAKIFTLIPNIYICWHAHDKVKPFVGMGVGYVKIKHQYYERVCAVDNCGKDVISNNKFSESNIAAQIIIGTKVKLTDNIFLTADHRRIKHDGLPCSSINGGIIVYLDI